MFDAAGREALRTRLVLAAQADGQVVGAALLGSAARGESDRWSDIDLALRLEPGADPASVAEAWTALVAETEGVVDHLDLHASGALYRVLLLGSSLQVDLSFWPNDQPLAAGGPVEVLLGDVPVGPFEPRDVVDRAVDAVRMGWLYALHVRSALGRGRVWQARWMLEGMRGEVVALCCRRFGLPAAEGRGVDRLPAGLLTELADSLPTTLEVADLRRGFRVVTRLLLAEAGRQGLPVSADLTRVLTGLPRVDDPPGTEP